MYTIECLHCIPRKLQNRKVFQRYKQDLTLTSILLYDIKQDKMGGALGDEKHNN